MDYNGRNSVNINPMKKNIVVAAILILLGVAQIAAAQLYTCTGQNDACTICDFFAMMVRIIGITLKFVVPSAIILAVIAAGVMMMLKQEDPDVWARAKKIMLTAIIGGLVVYGGWLLVSVSLAGMNSFNKDTWWKFELVCTQCGDGVLQTGEECEPGLSEVSCDEFCKIITEKKTEIQDRCGTANGGKDLTNPEVGFDIVRAHGFVNSGGNERRVSFFSFNMNAYTCDEVCASRGQKCIGVGLTNVATNRCVSVIHHVNGICELSGNLSQGSGCSDHYRISDDTCLEISSPCEPELEPCGVYEKSTARHSSAAANSGAVDGKSYVQFSVHEAACYCQ